MQECPDFQIETGIFCILNNIIQRVFCIFEPGIRMKKVLFLFMLLLPVVALCIDKHKLKNMPVSRWREISRLKIDSTVVPFYDTMFISFRIKDSFSYHNKNGFIYNGAYTINEDSLLDFGTARYKILEKKPASLVLINDAGIYRFAKDSSDTTKIIVLEKDEKILPVTDIDQMIGHWTVYKRTEKEQAGGTIDNAVTIRSVYITGPSTDGKLGYVFSGNDPSSAPSWYIKSYGSDQTIVCNGKNPRALKVIKCQKGELILEEDGTKYYFKQFK